jgi:hypothetical protein
MVLKVVVLCTDVHSSSRHATVYVGLAHVPFPSMLLGMCHQGCVAWGAIKQCQMRCWRWVAACSELPRQQGGFPVKIWASNVEAQMCTAV